MNACMEFIHQKLPAVSWFSFGFLIPFYVTEPIFSQIAHAFEMAWIVSLFLENRNNLDCLPQRQTACLSVVK